MLGWKGNSTGLGTKCMLWVSGVSVSWPPQRFCMQLSFLLDLRKISVVGACTNSSCLFAAGSFDCSIMCGNKWLHPAPPLLTRRRLLRYGWVGRKQRRWRSSERLPSRNVLYNELSCFRYRNRVVCFVALPLYVYEYVLEKRVLLFLFSHVPEG